MGNTCKSMADSFQCMTKHTTIKNKKKKEKEIRKKNFFKNKKAISDLLIVFS